MAVEPRRKAVVVDVGGVKVGGEHPIVVQSMTNTDTADIASTVNQVMALGARRFRAGARHGEHRSGRRRRAQDRRHHRGCSAFPCPSLAISTITATSC